jgi:pimeloyl-ACP methyl ester carboxylesterase
MEDHNRSSKSPRPNRREFLVTTGSTVAAGVIAHSGRLINEISSPQPYQQQSKMKGTKPSIVFCHGLWADGSCFSKVIGPLQAEGYECIAAQYGLNSTAEDVALVKATIGRVSSPVILVGHSYGGTVITGAGTDDRVAGLVYIAALAPDADETSQTQLSNFPKTDVFSQIDVVDGRIWLRPEGTKYFCGDLSEKEQKLVWATQGVPKPDLFDAKAGGTAWKSKPNWYIVAKNDHTVPPDLERFFAKRMGATTTEAASSHVVMLAQPQVVIDVIQKAVKTVQGAKATAQKRTSLLHSSAGPLPSIVDKSRYPQQSAHEAALIRT